MANRDMSRASKQTSFAIRWPVTRGFAVLFLLLSLGIAGLSLHAWYTALHGPRPQPGDLRLYSGVVESVSHGHNKYGGVTGIRFRIEAADPEFSYADFYPSFELAKSCVVRGASVTVGVTTPSSDVWQLSCHDKMVSDINSTAQARLANGRAGRNVGIGFGLLGVFWAWLILSGRAVAKKASWKKKKVPRNSDKV
jgi:hypothetical protein